MVILFYVGLPYERLLIVQHTARSVFKARHTIAVYTIISIATMTSGATSPAHSSDPKTSTMAQASLKPRQWPPVTEVGIERTCGRRDLPRTWWKNTKYLQPP